ncbi:helix-turn-helix domain-containing protein [Flavobacteriaceae bacterium W22]|nr:helix-turn-helix domain-containing protein [Flavobacteriaceae bacterium W22]
MKYPSPDYKLIFTDILDKKFPHKKEKCQILLKKKNLSAMDIIELNNNIFNTPDRENQKYRSYSKSDILKILDYQKNHKLNNTQLSTYFKLSRNSVTKWKKMFLV